MMMGTGGTSNGGGGTGGNGMMVTEDGSVMMMMPPPTPGTKLTHETATIAGRSRKFILVMPDPVEPSRAYPLIFMFHGDGGVNGDVLHNQIQFETVSKADAVVVYPDGLGGDGNGGAWDLVNAVDSNFDYPILKGIPDALAARVKIDPARIYGFGYSAGGFFINKAACVAEKAFRAIAENAGGQPYNGDNEFTPKFSNGCLQCANKTPTLIMHGKNDDVVNYGTGVYATTCQGTVNGCQVESRTPTTPSPCETLDGCSAGNPVIFCGLAGVDHGVWSGSAQTSWAFFQTQK